MKYVLFDLSHKSQVAIIKLNRPEVCNALNIDMILQLNQYFKQIADDQNIKILLITANGPNFSSGADLNWMKNSVSYTQEQNFQDARQLALMLWHLYNLNKPVVCAIQGNVYGGAIGIVTCADIVIAAKNSKFGFTEVRLGLAPAIISSFVLQTMQVNFAKYSMITAKSFNIEEAYRFGLVQEIVENNHALEQAMWNNIDNLLSLDFNGIMVTKQILRNSHQQISLEKLEDCAKILAELRTLPHTQLLIKNFIDKLKK